ncbi:chromate transporter [Treponema rectale]|uniref:Chromate transporter n=1 Tax=Treponema rectale TaxID=744512 RepID=A0A840SJR6_9SPIR|nr:chromate transporter [Treponema rectale]MBB5219611.1 chromate transporter [Treponema rectale]
MTLIHLFFIFFYIGLFAVGGGLVAATFMQQALVEQYHLLSAEKFYSMLAISESTPGPIGINLATYIGTELYGPIGGIITTFGEVLPSLIVTMLIARFFSKFQEKPLTQNIFSFLRPATTGMVLVALIQVLSLSIINTQSFKTTCDFIQAVTNSPRSALDILLNWKAIALYELCLVILYRTKLHPVFIVVLSAVFGIIFL